jgi:2-methylcitrate dehydratase PrpD
MTAAATEVGTHVTRALSDYAVGLTYDDLPAGIVESAKLFTLECIGHMVSGQDQPVGRILIEAARELSAAGRATIVGAGLRTSLGEAAYVNGALAHADELEAYGTLPGTGLVPPIAAGLAAGEAAGSSGRAFVAALVAGIEIQGRLGTAALGAPDRGFMGFSLVGPAGAVVAAGKLRGLDAPGLGNAFGIAMPLSGGSLRGCGYMTHVHEAGVPARVGVQAVELTLKGFIGCPDIFDGEHSWGDQFASGGRGYHPEKLTEGLGESFFLDSSGAAPKIYGSCGLTHLALEGLIGLMQDERIDPTDIDRVELVAPPFATRVASFEDPVGGDEAKFSIRQAIAGLLVDGVPELPYIKPFTDEGARDERYVRARERVTLITDHSVPNVRSFNAQTITTVLHDGRRLSTTVDPLSVRGRESKPMSLDERLAMVRNTVRAHLAPDTTERLITAVMGCEDHPIGDVMRLLDPAT